MNHCYYFIALLSPLTLLAAELQPGQTRDCGLYIQVGTNPGFSPLLLHPLTDSPSALSFYISGTSIKQYVDEIMNEKIDIHVKTSDMPDDHNNSRIFVQGTPRTITKCIKKYGHLSATNNLPSHGRIFLIDTPRKSDVPLQRDQVKSFMPQCLASLFCCFQRTPTPNTLVEPLLTKEFPLQPLGISSQTRVE